MAESPDERPITPLAETQPIIPESPLPNKIYAEIEEIKALREEALTILRELRGEDL